MNSVLMPRAVERAGVPAELHVFATGGHGFGLRPTGDPSGILASALRRVDEAPGLARRLGLNAELIRGLRRTRIDGASTKP